MQARVAMLVEHLPAASAACDDKLSLGHALYYQIKYQLSNTFLNIVLSLNQRKQGGFIHNSDSKNTNRRLKSSTAQFY